MPGGGPFEPNGADYERDLGYGADLERAIAVVVAHFKPPNDTFAAFLRAQSREEVGYGALFSTRLNFWNVGNVDSDPKAGGGYDTPEAAGQAYVDFIDNGSPSNTYALFIAAIQDPNQTVLGLATLIKQGGYASDPTYPQDVASKA